MFMNWQEMGKWVAGIIAALVAGGLVFRFVLIRKSGNNQRSVTQTTNRAGRDIIGGDKIDKH